MHISSPLTRFIFICGVLWALSTQAQTKDPAAILQLDTTTQGLLPPRMTTAQRDAIDSPPDGLMIYNTDTQRLNYYRGYYSGWAIARLGGDKVIHNGLAYRELTSTATNEIRLDRNVGALRAPKSISDTGSAFLETFIHWLTLKPVAHPIPPPHQSRMAGRNRQYIAPKCGWGLECT